MAGPADQDGNSQPALKVMGMGPIAWMQANVVFSCTVIFLSGIVHRSLRSMLSTRVLRAKMSSAGTGLFASAQNLTQRCIQCVLFALTQTVSYILMTIAMSLDPRLFAAVILGQAVGFWCFDTGQWSTETQILLTSQQKVRQHSISRAMSDNQCCDV